MTNATMEQQAREQVQAYVAGRIVRKLAKMGAVEETALRDSVRAVQNTHKTDEDLKAAERHITMTILPASVVTATMKTLAETGQIKRFRSNGATFIARRNAKRDELIAAVKLTIGAQRSALADPETRREAYADGIISSELARKVPLTDPEEMHYSEQIDAMTYEGSVASDPFEAEISSDTSRAQDTRQATPARSVPGFELDRGFDPYDDGSATRFGRPTIYGSPKLIDPLAQRRIDYQLQRPGMAERNAAKARARYLKTNPFMQQRFARKEMEENARREERRAFRAGESSITAMSPEQAHADHDRD